MIKRSYHIRIEVKPQEYEKEKEKGNTVVLTAIVDYRSFFAKPDDVLSTGWKLAIEKIETFTEENTMVVAFARC